MRHNEGMTGERPQDNIGEELEREARRRAETHAVIPAGKRHRGLRRFGRAWTYVTALYGLFLLGFSAYMAAQGHASVAVAMLPVALMMAAVTWLGHYAHYKAQPPSLTLTPEGLVVHAIPRIGPIPWDEIEDISSKPFLLFPTLRLKVRDYRSLRARLSPRDRRLLWMYRLPGHSIGINGILFGDRTEDAVQSLRRYWLYGPVDAASPVERVAPGEAATQQFVTPTPAGQIASASQPTTVTVSPAAEHTPQQVVAGRRAWWQE